MTQIIMETIYESTDDTGLRVVTWFNVGTRNFYAKKPINTPNDRPEGAENACSTEPGKR